MRKNGVRARIIFTKTAAAIVALALISAALCGCAKKEGAGVKYLGSFLSADVYLYLLEELPASTYDKMFEECKATVAIYEKTFSLAVGNSDISRFNAAKYGETVSVSALAGKLVAYAQGLYELTEGYFDPSVYPLVDLWGFSYRFDKTYSLLEAYDRPMNEDGSFDLPDSEYTEGFLSLCDFFKVDVKTEDGAYYLTKNCTPVTVKGETYEQRIDLSALAKGALSDALQKIVDRYAKDYYLSLGTSSLYLSERGGDNWNVQLVDPLSETRAAFAEVPVKKRSVATSGVYEKNYTVDGKTYHHIIDPTTGKSAETDILSVAVIGDNGTICDALSTALIAMGFERAKEFISKTSGYNFVIVLNSGEVWSDIEVKAINSEYSYKSL